MSSAPLLELACPGCGATFDPTSARFACRTCAAVGRIYQSARIYAGATRGELARHSLDGHTSTCSCAACESVAELRDPSLA